MKLPQHQRSQRIAQPAVGAIGVVPLSPTQDIPGPLARSAADLRLASEVLSGKTFAVSDEPLSIGIWHEGFHAEALPIGLELLASA